MHSSVRSHADPGAATALAAADITAGTGEYKSMCEHCHGGPGVEPAAWSRGMKPRPPHLVEAAREWSAGEVKWIIENGIKYTGMPAFGADHDDATLWSIAAFVKCLPGMTPEQYRAFGPAHAYGTASGGSEHAAAGASMSAAGETPPAPSENGHTHVRGHAHGDSH
jgi:cytochrome c553